MLKNMKPTTKIYTFKMGNKDDLSHDFSLKAFSEQPHRLRPCGFGDIDGVIHLPWMKKDALVAWFRKAADLIEEANFE